MNTGRIVVIVRPYRKGEYVGGVNDWLDDGRDGSCGRHWIVTSLGDGLSCYPVVNGRPGELRTVMSMPISDHRLAPLGDEEGGIESSALRRRVETRKSVK